MATYMVRFGRSGLPAMIRALCLIAGLAGCATVAPPDAAELGDIEAGRKVLVLLRVAASIAGEPHEPFAHRLVDDNIGIGIGSFETGGRPQRVEQVRFLSAESRARGWTYLSAPPGAIYLAFLPPRRADLYTYLDMFDAAPLWRVDLPQGSRSVYAGTLVVEGEGGSFTFGGKYIKAFSHMEVRDERGEAETLLRRHLPGARPAETRLMQRHEGPVILTTPPR